MNRVGRRNKACTTSTPATAACPNRGKYEWYIVYKGREPGIYDNWEEANAQVCGYSGNCYKGFHSYAQALKSWVDHLGKQKGGHEHSVVGGGHVEGDKSSVDILAKQLDGLNVSSSRGSVDDSVLSEVDDGMNHKTRNLR